MSSDIGSVYRTIRRKVTPESGHSTVHSDRAFGQPSSVRMSGTNPVTLQEINSSPSDAGLGEDNPNGRTGNDWAYPDYPRGLGIIQTVNGDRLQDIANTHLSEGPAPGRVPHMWNNRYHGRLGRNITGSPSGDIGFTDTTSGQTGGGIGDMKLIPHIQIPRGVGMARAYHRGVADSAQVPAIYVADPTRR